MTARGKLAPFAATRFAAIEGCQEAAAAEIRRWADWW
jgi:hypothetical protein